MQCVADFRHRLWLGRDKTPGQACEEVYKKIHPINPVLYIVMSSDGTIEENHGVIFANHGRDDVAKRPEPS
jgi:hypothetical protein